MQDSKNTNYTKLNTGNKIVKEATCTGEMSTQILTGVQYVINSTILYARANVSAGGKFDDLARYVSKSAIERIAHCSPATLTQTVFPNNHFSKEELNSFAKRVKTFGASGKRTKEQTAAAAEFTAVYVNNLPINSIQAWTDGSKLGKGNSGPTGAGAMIIKTGACNPSHLLKYTLGNSTNQAAEIWAIGGALTTIRDEMDYSGAKIFIFSDSEFSIKCLTGVYNSKTHYQMLKQVTELIDAFPRDTVKFQHVAGHAGITGNDKADELANEGAKHSERSLETHQLSKIARTYGFNQQLIRDEFYEDTT